MNIFQHPTTPQNPVPSAAESRALSEAHQLLKVGASEMARRKLFQVFAPAEAERHFELIQRRLASPPPAAPPTAQPIVPKAQLSAPVPAPQSTEQPRPRLPLALRLVRLVIVVGLSVAVLKAITGR